MMYAPAFESGMNRHVHIYPDGNPVYELPADRTITGNTIAGWSDEPARRFRDWASMFSDLTWVSLTRPWTVDGLWTARLSVEVNRIRDGYGNPVVQHVWNDVYVYPECDPPLWQTETGEPLELLPNGLRILDGLEGDAPRHNYPTQTRSEPEPSWPTTLRTDYRTGEPIGGTPYEREPLNFGIARDTDLLTRNNLHPLTERERPIVESVPHRNRTSP